MAASSKGETHDGSGDDYDEYEDDFEEVNKIIYC